MKKKNNKNQITSFEIIAIVAALAVLGVVVVTVAALTIQLQEAEARGCAPGGTGYNASQGRCFRG
jgi:hypothetical protein